MIEAFRLGFYDLSASMDIPGKFQFMDFLTASASVMETAQQGQQPRRGILNKQEMDQPEGWWNLVLHGFAHLSASSYPLVQ